MSFDTWNATVWLDSFGGPSRMPVAQPGNDCAGAFEDTDSFGPLENVGGSFTAVTVIGKDWVGLSSVDPPPSSWA